MKKMKSKSSRLFSLFLALALMLTSVSIPSETAQAAETGKVKKIQITKPKKKSVTLKKGKTLQLKVKVTPKNAVNKKVKYKTSNRKVARVSSKGKIKAVKNGTAKITVTARDGSKKKAVLKVKVVTLASKVKLDASSQTLSEGQSIALKATVLPASASRKTVKWTTSDKNVAAVTSKGVVTGVKAGTAVITATAADGSKKKASCTVTVQAVSQTPTPPNPDNPDDPTPPNPDNPDNPDDPTPPGPDNPDDPTPPGPDNPDDPTPPEEAVLEKIEITKQPSQTGYWTGEKFDPSGMEVTAFYSDGTEKILDAGVYTLTPSTETPLTLQDEEVVVSYQEGGITKADFVAITVTEEPPVSLSAIEIKKQPDKTEYRVGERFDPAGMEVEAVYSDGSKKPVKVEECSYEPDRALALDDTEVTVAYQEFGRPQTAVVTVTVIGRPKVALKSIEITTQPNKTEYWEGERFDAEGMRVTAVYADGTEMGVGGDVCVIEPDRPLTVSDREVAVTYQDGDVSLSKKVSITVRKLTLKKIEVTAMPSKTTYNEGDTFDKTGMEVTATYMNGSTEVITDYTCSDGPLDPADQVVEISYTKNGVTKKTAIDIVVVAKVKLDRITCELKNTEPEIEGTVFREQDIEVTAHFEDGTSEKVSISKCKVSPSAFTLKTTSATVYYTYGTRKKSCKVTGFTVKPYRERYTFEDKDTVGTIVKHSAEGHNLPTEENAGDVNPQFVEGLSGKALKMDGSYGLRLDKIAGIDSNSYSISMWLKPDEIVKDRALIISTANEFGLKEKDAPLNWCAVSGVNAQGEIKLWSNGSSGIDATKPAGTAAQGTVSVGAEWTHIALVVDGNTTAEGTDPAEGSKKALGTLYINGRKVGSGNVQNEKCPDMKTYLGVTGWEWDKYYSGLVDELVFTNEVFTPEEVEGYYLEQYADKLAKITEVTANAEADIEVEYGTSLADVKRVLAEKVTLSGTDGSKQFSFENTADIWTLENYTVTTQGEVTAVAKVEAPAGHAFSLENNKASIWKQIPVKVKVKEPEMITQVMPSENQIEVLYGTTEAQIKEKLAALAFAVTTEHGKNYSIKNAGSLWSLTVSESGYTATARLPRADVGYEYAEGQSQVIVQIIVKQPVVITGLTVEKNKISVPYNSTLSYVQGELAKLKITGAVSDGEAPALANKAELWTIAEYLPDTAGEYTATAKIAAPVGYKYAEGSENIDSITVAVEVAEKSDQKKLVSIGISKQPDITRYIQGHTFNKTGMVVEAIYANGDREDVTDKVMVVDEAKPLELTDTFVKISYTEEDETEESGAVTVTQDCSISVVELKDGAAVYYSFDETLADKRTDGRTAKLVDNGSLAANAALEPVYAEGVKGQGILLNSTDKKAALELNANVPSSKKDFTINLWVQPRSLDQTWAIILSGGNAQWSKELVLYANPELEKVSYSDTINVQNGTDPDTNFKGQLFKDQWIMLTCANSEGKMEFYANGKKLGDASPVKNGITRLFLGGGWWDPFHGVFDEFSMYDCTLTAEEVAELYHHVPWNIEKIEYEKELTVTKKNSSEAAVKTELARLPLHAVMRNGEAPALNSDEEWTLNGTSEEGYTATKELQLPEGYAMPDGAKKVVLTVKVSIRNGELTGLRVTPPAKDKYLEGEKFDKAGMKVEAEYTEEGTEPTYKDVTELVILSENGEPLAADKPLKVGTHTITVTYIEGSDTKTGEITLIVQTMEEALNGFRLAQYSFDNDLENGVGNGSSAKRVTVGAMTDLAGNPVYEEGIDGQGIRLNGSTAKEALELGTKIEEGADFSINFWVQPKDLRAGAALLFGGAVSQDRGLTLYGNQDGSGEHGVTLMTNKPDGSEKAVIKKDLLYVDKWTMFTLVNSAEGTVLYADGKLEGKGSRVTTSIARLFLGGSWWGNECNCIFDEVSVFSRALQDQEVQYLYGLVPPTVSEISVNQKELMFLLSDVSGNADKIKEVLSKLEINVTMKHGEKCEFKNDTNWTVPSIEKEDTYTAVKKLELPDGYVMKDGSKEAELTVAFTVKDAQLTGLEIASQPNRRVYLAGETFDPAGMAVRAKYSGSSGNSEQDVTDKVIIAEAGKALAADDKQITVSYEEGGISKTVQIDINVYAADQPEAIYAARTAYYTFDGDAENAWKNEITDGMAVEEGINQKGEGNVSFVENGVNGKAAKIASKTGKGIKLDSKITTKNYTISMWVKAEDLKYVNENGGTNNKKYTPVLYAGGNSDNYMIWYALYGADDKFTIRTVVNRASSELKLMTDVVEESKWKMLTLTMEGEKAVFYVDGAKQTEEKLADFFEGQERDIYLGTGLWDETFTGEYDEISMFNRTLTAAEVNYLYSAVPWTVEKISASEGKLTFGNTATETDIRKKLSELTITAAMKNGKAPEFVNDEEWTLTPAVDGAGTYTATRELTLPDHYQMSDGAKTYTLSVEIEVKGASLTDIKIEKMPGKTAFLVGDAFDKSIFTDSGMKVNAYYSDGNSVDVTDAITVDKKGALTKDDTKIILSYSEGESKTAEVPIQVYTAEETGSMYVARASYYTFDDETLENTYHNEKAKLVQGAQQMNECQDSPVFENGKHGKGIHLNASGTPTALELDNKIKGSEEYTINFWVQPKSVEGAFALLFGGKANDRGLTLWGGNIADNATSSEVTLMMNGKHTSDGKFDAKLAVDKWTMLTWVNSSSGTIIYADGEQIGTAPRVTSVCERLFLGETVWADHSCNGVFDEVSQFNKALTAEQVKALHAEIANLSDAAE